MSYELNWQNEAEKIFQTSYCTMCSVYCTFN